MALIKRVDQLQQNQTFTNPQSYTGDSGQSIDPFTNQQTQFHDKQRQTLPIAMACTPSNMRVHTDISFRVHPSVGYTSVPASSLPLTAQGGDDMWKDAVLPDLNTLRQNQTVSQAVAQLVASYKQQAWMDFTQGRQHLVKCSGRYNTTDVITEPPHLRWANEGFHMGNGKKMGYL